MQEAAGALALAPLPPQEQLEEDAGWAVGFPAAEALAEERDMLPPDADEDLYAQVSRCSWPVCYFRRSPSTARKVVQ